jgi:hypothetical protein
MSSGLRPAFQLISPRPDSTHKLAFQVSILVNVGDFAPMPNYCKLFFCFLQKISAIKVILVATERVHFYFPMRLIIDHWRRPFSRPRAFNG